MILDDTLIRMRGDERNVPRLAPTIYCPHRRIEACIAAAVEQAMLLQSVKP
jgi:hypothetical protein